MKDFFPMWFPIIYVIGAIGVLCYSAYFATQNRSWILTVDGYWRDWSRADMATYVFWTLFLVFCPILNSVAFFSIILVQSFCYFKRSLIGARFHQWFVEDRPFRRKSQ